MQKIKLVVKLQKGNEEFTKTFRGLPFVREYATKNKVKILKIDVIRLA